MRSKIKFLAYYLPQYHPIPENDEWWGKGFTEWTNVKKALPVYKGHKQPIIPGELGYYDLLKDIDVQKKQADLAKQYGIDGFIYYQYWFGGGKMLLEKPAEKMLADKSIDLPFCFCWANETWSGIWHGAENKILIEQKYLGKNDYIQYFEYLLPFFKDDRYIKIDNKPVFHIYRVDDIPDLQVFLETLNNLAIKNGFKGIHFIATGNVFSQNVMNNPLIQQVVGLDLFQKLRKIHLLYFKEGTFLYQLEQKIKYRLGYLDELGKRRKPMVIDYKKSLKKLFIDVPHSKYLPCIIPNWDNSPRSGKISLILKNSTPELFKKYIEKVLKSIEKSDYKPDFIIIKSWNEWAEGNYLEPDQIYGRKWLEVIKELKNKMQ